MKTAYIVVREGAHRHEILGVFDNRTYADIHQDRAVGNEVDNYHSIVVYRCRINESETSLSMNAVEEVSRRMKEMRKL